MCICIHIYIYEIIFTIQIDTTVLPSPPKPPVTPPKETQGLFPLPADQLSNRCCMDMDLNGVCGGSAVHQMHTASAYTKT